MDLKTVDYRERIYSRYRETHIRADSPLTREVLAYDLRLFRKVFGPLLPQDRKAEIFELGCGSGSFLNFLYQEGYAEASGMEQDPAHIKAASDLGIKNALQGDAFAHLAGQTARYDCIVAIDVIEHFTKAELFGCLDIILKALKPGGTFIWRAPNGDGPFAGRIRYGDLTHELAFTKASAWQLMGAAGFINTQVYPEEPVATGARSLLRVALWKGFRMAAKLYLFAESYAHKDSLLSANLIVSARKP